MEHPEHGEDRGDPVGPDTPSPSIGAGVLEARLVERINQKIPGTLLLHYKARTIPIDVSGDVAHRFMTVFRRGRADGLTDVIDLDRSLAFTPRVQFRWKELLSMTWEPGVDAIEAVDPDLLALLAAITASEPEGEATEDGSEGS
jgi:hypothetical protein